MAVAAAILVPLEVVPMISATLLHLVVATTGVLLLQFKPAGKWEASNIALVKHTWDSEMSIPNTGLHFLDDLWGYLVVFGLAPLNYFHHELSALDCFYIFTNIGWTLSLLQLANRPRLAR